MSRPQFDAAPNASALSSGDAPMASLRGDDLRDAHLRYMTATGRQNSS
ncbi:MAG: hypothetical protein ACK5H2_11165 [Beutenbergiaceae bacterium]